MDKEKKTTNIATYYEKIKESFSTALVSAGIVLAVVLLLWIPFKVIPFVYENGSKLVSTTLSSMFISDEASSTSTVQEKNVDETKAKLNTSNASVAQTQKTYYGNPDLEVTLISTGIIDPATKQYVQTNYAGYNDEIAIRFQVKNIGTNVSGQWKLRINAPSRTTPYYDSEYQTSIKPGDRIIYTTTFNSPTSTGINTAYITADPLNMIAESSESNNQLTVPLRIDGTYYTYNNNYNYGQSGTATNVSYGTLYTWTNISVNCYASQQTSYVGNPITWYATVSGGNGYYTYSWSGSDGLTANESAISKTYYSSGTKMASVTVTSNGQSVTGQCSTYVY